MEPRHEQIARIALAAGARYGLALAGGYAIAAHGMGNRPSGDVDLFTSWLSTGVLTIPFSLPSGRSCTPMTPSLTRSARWPRDFLDVDAAIMSGRYTREQLLELAAEADHGFDRLLFADALGALTQITDSAFAEYRTDPGTIADMRHRFAQWRRELLPAEPS
jgi:hypothetical protein